jgi:hypothetical protein
LLADFEDEIPGRGQAERHFGDTRAALHPGTVSTWSHVWVGEPSRKELPPMATSSSEGDGRREFWRRIAAAIAQGLSREALVIILREVLGRGPWSL